MEFSFVGRSGELAQLSALYDQASQDRGSIAIVFGEPGVGKSRLIRQFVSSIPGGSVLTVAAHEVSESPLRLWKSVATATDRKLGLPNEGIAFVFGEDEEPTAAMADVAERILALLLELPAPVVLVIEDLQWADPASQRLLHHLSAMVASEPVMIVATQRVDFADHTVIDGPGDARLINLGGLAQADVSDALTRRYPEISAPEIATAAARLAELTGGNPLACFGTIVGLERSRGPADVLEHLSQATYADVETTATVQNAIQSILAALSASDCQVLAALVLTGESNPSTLAMVLHGSEQDIVYAQERALAVGILVRRGRELEIAHPLLGSSLLSGLPDITSRELNARYADVLAAADQPDWGLILTYALRSGGLIPDARIAEVADSAGFQAFEALAFEDADRYLEIAQDRDLGLESDLRHRTDRLMRRAESNVRIARMDVAYDLYRQAADNAVTSGDADTLARAAIGFAFPPDWRAGNADALGLLMVAEEALAAKVVAGPLAVEEAKVSPAAIQLKALRAMLEMRIPQPSDDGEQWAWVVRAEVAQPRADQALALARSAHDKRTSLIALLAWRWTHRGPKFLSARTAVSREALDLALELNAPLETVEACVRLLVDHLEAGDRQAADDVFAVAEWLNKRVRDSRVEWRTYGLRAGLAGIDGDWEEFERCRQNALDAGNAAGIPGAFVMDHALRTQRSILVRDVDYMLANEEMVDLVPMHPLTNAAVSCAQADLGRIDDALDRIERTFPLLDEESSLLQSLAYLGKATLMTGDKGHAQRLLPMLTPWVGRVAVDAEALMSTGALGLVVADLAELAGDPELAASARITGDEVHRQLHGTIGSVRPGVARVGAPRLLTDREISVLQEIVRGRTNAEIANVLNFSLATVRRDTISIYNKLNVRGRANAASRAVELGLITR